MWEEYGTKMKIAGNGIMPMAAGFTWRRTTWCWYRLPLHFRKRNRYSTLPLEQNLISRFNFINMSINNGIIKDTEKHVYDLFDKYYQDNLVFHNIDHTRSVVQRVQEIASHHDLDEKDMKELLVAAWFHDTGHLLTEPANHEQKSVELMREFLSSKVNDEESVDRVANLIKMTKLPPSPQTLQEKIICDADTYHFGVDDFKKTNK